LIKNASFCISTAFHVNYCYFHLCQVGCPCWPGNGYHNTSASPKSSSHTLLFKNSDKVLWGNKVFRTLYFLLCSSWRLELIPLS